jgi:sigma-E factor negative regulatory protein RseB
LVVGSVSAAERSAQEWLDYMARAMRETSYTGTFVYRYGDQLETMAIVHRADGDGERERLVTLNGKRREIIRDDTEVTCIFPDHDSVVVDRRQVRNPLNDLVPSERADLGQSYELAMRGEGRVADREVVRIGIRPTDGYRYGYELAIDRDTGLLLASDLLAEDGDRVVEQIMFTSIELPSRIPDAALEQTIDGEDFTWHRRQREADQNRPLKNDSGWDIDPAPEGFDVAMRERHTLPGRDVMVEHWLYTDGLATVSVYIERTKADDGAFHGRSQMGAINVFGRMIGPYQIVVVGEVPAVTVESIGRSIKRRDGETP